jgi:hypothetical protein
MAERTPDLVVPVLGRRAAAVASELFAQLAGQGLVAPERLHWPKGSTWLLHRTDWRQVHTRYLSPLALDRRLHTG